MTLLSFLCIFGLKNLGNSHFLIIIDFFHSAFHVKAHNFKPNSLTLYDLLQSEAMSMGTICEATACKPRSNNYLNISKRGKIISIKTKSLLSLTGLLVTNDRLTLKLFYGKKMSLL